MLIMYEFEILSHLFRYLNLGLLLNAANVTDTVAYLSIHFDTLSRKKCKILNQKP